MKKILIFVVALTATALARAGVLTPTLTTDPDNPTYYVIQNLRSRSLANYAGASTQLTQVAASAATINSLWYFVANGEGVSIVPAADPTLKLASYNSATASGAVWYLPENPHNGGMVCVSLTSDASANCWDDQSGKIGYYRPNNYDYFGTSWSLVEVNISKTDAEANASNIQSAIALPLSKEEILSKITPLSSTGLYDGAVANINAATTEAEITDAIKSFNPFVTFQCRSNNYLEVGASGGSHNSSPSANSNVIQLVSVGDGSFYLKGYKSGKYLSDVAQSTAVTVDDTPTIPYYIQRRNGYIVMRPVKYGSFSSLSGYQYIHNGGSGCVGWTSGADNTQYTMRDFGDPDNIIDVNFEVYYGGNLATSATVGVGYGARASVPAVLTRDYLDYTIEKAVATTTGQKVRIDASNWSGPFEFSSDVASAHWYDMAVRGTWYVTSDQQASDGALETVNANAMGLAEDAYQWAFVGSDPWHIKLYNKADVTKAYSWTSNGNGSIPAFTDAASANYWWIKKSTSSIANSFMLTTPDYGYQVNQFGGAGGSLKVWAATGTGDAGSAFTVFDVPDDFHEYAVAEILPYLGEGSYFVLTDAAKAQIGWQDSYETSCPFAAYKAMKLALETVLADASNFIIPETGHYRLKSKMYSTYMGQTGSLVVGNFAAAEANGISTVISFVKNDAGQYSISVQGNYLQAATNSKSVPYSDTPAYFTAAVPTTGYGAFAVDPTDTYTFLHRRGTGDLDIVGWEAAADASMWALEDAEDVVLTLHAGEDAYWATLYAPFGVELPAGTEAYIANVNTAGNLNLTSIGTKVPAATAVILRGNAETITATINDGIEAITATNALEGQYLAATDADDTKLTLGQKDGVVGFYTISSALGANKAFLSVTTPVKGFTFTFSDDDLTGIENSEKRIENSDSAVYDLYGRKVAAPQKGQLYIVNGKKVKY